MLNRPKKKPARIWNNLISASISGDDVARDSLARECLPRVRRTVIFTYGPGPEGDDLVQIAMSKVFSKMDSFRHESGFYAWVDKVTINVVRDHFRSRKWKLFEAYDDGRFSAESNPQDCPDRQYERHLLLKRLAEHFEKLKPSLRIPLVLSILHGYTLAEVAALMDISKHAAKKRLYRGRRELLDRLIQDPYCRDTLKGMV